jgi:pyrophosphatase PpaX
MLDTVIFDFDGTLADTSGLVINSFQTVYKKFHGEEKPVEYISKFFGEPLKVTLEREFTQPLEEVMKEYREYQVSRFNDDVKLFNNTREILQYLKSKNIKMAIVTSRMKFSVEKALRDFDIEKYFDVVIAIEDTKNHKPHPEPLWKAIDCLNTSADKVLFVGDSKYDIECAINANVTPVLVAWSIEIEELKNQYNIKHIIDDFSNIEKLIP